MIIDKTTDQRMFYLKDRLFTGEIHKRIAQAECGSKFKVLG